VASTPEPAPPDIALILTTLPTLPDIALILTASPTPAEVAVAAVAAYKQSLPTRVDRSPNDALFKQHPSLTSAVIGNRSNPQSYHVRGRRG
jgi:hypothetical protein